ncbi:CaiB/BaiF CoA transferase family protein [Sphingomicrobium marinum]|uniref:CaiB/BaiF CoA transferase family protein n=1 Tax=Sphingomicrobium marinum TaxID=1227950 RepID=UPI002240BFB7|nr:CaiB/BaiF CoA-transferase family protein [Sphingomicrobium marinum]
MTGPLSGVRIIELAGIGPGPFAAMMLADHGAEVIRIEKDGLLHLPGDPQYRGRRGIKLDLKREVARAAFLKLVATADALIDPYRPGKLEALGLGPGALHAVNPALVIGRVTGWGQHGPMAQRAGHDINYLAISGLLHGMGEAGGRPLPPSNLVADYGAGAMMLAFAMAASLREVAAGTEKGRVIDCAMSEESALLGTFLYSLHNAGLLHDQREAGLLDGGSGLYGTYETADGKWLAVGAMEPQFRARLLDGLGLAGDERFEDTLDDAHWPAQKHVIAETIASRPLQHWLDLFEDVDACVTPVLTKGEAPSHPHNVARWTFYEHEMGPMPAPAPRYGKAPLRPAQDGEGGAALLRELGYDGAAIADILGEAE